MPTSVSYSGPNRQSFAGTSTGQSRNHSYTVNDARVQIAAAPLDRSVNGVSFVPFGPVLPFSYTLLGGR